MKTYNFIYTIDNIECQMEINAKDETTVLETVMQIIPNATKITLIK